MSSNIATTLKFEYKILFGYLKKSNLFNFTEVTFWHKLSLKNFTCNLAVNIIVSLID